jgi:sulfur relay (sulfurtransferase) DsrF/TusC family protein
MLKAIQIPVKAANATGTPQKPYARTGIPVYRIKIAATNMTARTDSFFIDGVFKLLNHKVNETIAGSNIN